MNALPNEEATPPNKPRQNQLPANGTGDSEKVDALLADHMAVFLTLKQ